MPPHSCHARRLTQQLAAGSSGPHSGGGACIFVSMRLRLPLSLVQAAATATCLAAVQPAEGPQGVQQQPDDSVRALGAIAKLGLQVVDCGGDAAGPWTFAASGALVLSSRSQAEVAVAPTTGLCLEPGAAIPAHEQLVLTGCSGKPTAWNATTAPGFPTFAISGVKGSWGPAVLLGHVVVGQPAILYSLEASKGYCNSHHSCDFVYNASSKVLSNPETGLCLGSGPAPKPSPPPSPQPPPSPHPSPAPPNLEYSCAPGQPLAGTPTCNRSLGFAARAKDLASRLNISDHVDLFFSYPGTPFIPSLNVKGWSLDHTCIHGINKQRNITLFPHEISQGASFDPDLVRRVLNATAVEARILSAKAYVSSGGKVLGAVLSCDGGPSAAQAHDPRWGRISWTWGEDPFHIAVMGSAAYEGLQSPRPVPGGQPTDRFLATRATVPYYLGYHGGSMDPKGSLSAFNATKRSLADSYWPAYGALLESHAASPADGVMCAMSSVNGVPSCVDPLLLKTMLRETWQSDAIIQTDCCDSVGSVKTFLKITPAEALARYISAGGGAYFGFDANMYRPLLMEGLKNGTIKHSDVVAIGTRAIETELKLGFFDQHSTDYPYANESSALDWDLLDGSTHRELAAEAAAKSTVMIKNLGLLPLGKANRVTQAAQKRLAVVGPFARCAGGLCYAHDYAGTPSFTNDFASSISSMAAQLGWPAVSYAQGSNDTCATRCDSTLPSHWVPCEPDGTAASAVDDAVSLAQTADITVLAVGLGEKVEGEGCDRPNMTLPYSQQLLYNAVAKAVRSHGKQLIVVLVSAGGIEVDETVADAVLWQPYGGQASGDGLVRVLFGSYSPTARLPETFYKQVANPLSSRLDLL